MIIPRPTYREAPVDEGSSYDSPSIEWVRWYQSAADWKCGKCGAVMFGRVKYCVYCKVRLSTHTPRPDTYMDTSGSEPPK